jgi:hypothetical protein
LVPILTSKNGLLENDFFLKTFLIEKIPKTKRGTPLKNKIKKFPFLQVQMNSLIILIIIYVFSFLN